MSTEPMTIEGKKRIEEELEQLIKVDREEIKTAIAEARALGDLKENAEYHSAKEKQGHLEGRISYLQDLLGKVQVIDTASLDSETIVFGAKVTLCDEDGNESTYQIVGDEEADTKEKKISYKSPLAKAMIGKEEGDNVIVKAPKGDIEYEVLSFEF